MDREVEPERSGHRQFGVVCRRRGSVVVASAHAPDDTGSPRSVRQSRVLRLDGGSRVCRATAFVEAVW